MFGKFAGMAALAASLAIALFAQDAAELLQKGIYTQETEGNLDGAILIYRQIAGSAPAQRDIAAQAQYRLAQALLQKGDLSDAAAEFDRLARDYSEYRTLISSIAGSGRGHMKISLAQKEAIWAEIGARLGDVKELQKELQVELVQSKSQGTDSLDFPYGVAFKIRHGTATAAAQALSESLFSMQFDSARPVTVTGTVIKATSVNPMAFILIEGQDQNGNSGKWSFALASPKALEQHGIGGFTVGRPGERVTVNGDLGDGRALSDGSTPASANSVSSNGEERFNRDFFDK